MWILQEQGHNTSDTPTINSSCNLEETIEPCPLKKQKCVVKTEKYYRFQRPTIQKLIQDKQGHSILYAVNYKPISFQNIPDIFENKASDGKHISLFIFSIYSVLCDLHKFNF